ncbi:MAG: ArsR/SmtB family transcription factor [Candidatus Limnocylindrales bacterium]
MDEICVMQAAVLKTLANPRRLEILHRLAAGPCEVGRLAEEIGVSQPNVSQHLAVMRSAGLVEAERVGREVHYRLVDPEIIRACDILHDVLLRRLARLGTLSAATSQSAAVPGSLQVPGSLPLAEPV